MKDAIREKLGQLPSAERLEREIRDLEFLLACRDAPHTRLQARVDLWYRNAIRRKRKMLAAIRDGRPWAWPEYEV